MQFGMGLVGFPSFWRVSNDWGREQECIAESWLFGCTHLLSLLMCCNWLVFAAWNYAVVWQGVGLVGSWELQGAAPGPKEARHNLCHFASCWCMEERDVRGIPLDNCAILTQLSFCVGVIPTNCHFSLVMLLERIEDERIVLWLPAAENKWVSLQTTPVCSCSPRCRVVMGRVGSAPGIPLTFQLSNSMIHRATLITVQVFYVRI